MTIEWNVRSYCEGHACGSAEGMAQVLTELLRGVTMTEVFAECRRTHPRIDEEVRRRGFTIDSDGKIINPGAS